MIKIGNYRKNKIFNIKMKIFMTLIIAFMFFIPQFTMITKAYDTIIVDDDPGVGDYTSIQDAIDNSNVGDYIIVKDGTYGEQLSVYVNGLTITAASGETPTLYISPYSPGIDITASDVLIEGFEIYGNGSLTGGPFPTIRASSGSDGLIINNNQFKVFTGEIGQIALYISSGVKNVTFSSNTVINYNYQVYHAANIANQQIYFGSIQDAINEANPGQTVEVKPGIYQENLVINQQLNLKGYKAGISPIGRTGDESTIDGINNNAITIATGVSNVLIDGFNITISNKPNTNNMGGIIISRNTDNIEIKNNIISDITDGSGADTVSDETYGILVYGHEINDNQTNITISNNLIQNVEEYGIAINDITSYVTITNNVIENLIGSDHSTDPIWSMFPSWPKIICSGIHLGGQVGPINNVYISYNTIETNVIGDGIVNPAGGGISFAGVDDWTNPSRTWSGFQNISVIYNHIYNNTMGVVVLVGNFTNNTTYINFNNLSNNSQYGVNNQVISRTLNATNNWWGNISGPYNTVSNPLGIGTNVSDNVSYKPWFEFDGYSILPSVEYEVGNPKAKDGLIISDSTQISISAEDNESGLDTLQYRIWNSTGGWGEWMDYVNEFTISGDGKHMVQYNATDNAGNKLIDIETHYVDGVPPEVELIYPNGGEFLYNDVTILWKANDKIPDQEQINWNNSLQLPEIYPGHLQSFIPTENKLSSIQLLIDGDDANVSIKIFSDITGVPTQIGQSSKHLQYIGNPGSPVWIDFPFNPEISLDVGETYYIGVTQNIFGNNGFTWYYFNSSGGFDPYQFGNAWVKEIDQLKIQTEWDWAFRTIYWETDVDITVQYSLTGVSPWSTIAEDETNDGSYIWDTSSLPDGNSYRVRIIAEDYLSNMGADISDATFIVDNAGPSITDIIIRDTTINNDSYTKNGDNIEITATIIGDPINIEADLTDFGGGSTVSPSSYTGSTAKWNINSITCNPSDGDLDVMITATDATGDSGSNIGTIKADNTNPTVIITRPGPGLYIMDSMRLLPFSYPFIIGQITMSVDATDNASGSGIEKVEFYIENRLESTVEESPYTWLWDEAATGFFKLKVIAYDNVGLTKTVEMRDIFIINLDIFG